MSREDITGGFVDDNDAHDVGGLAYIGWARRSVDAEPDSFQETFDLAVLDALGVNNYLRIINNRLLDSQGKLQIFGGPTPINKGDLVRATQSAGFAKMNETLAEVGKVAVLEAASEEPGTYRVTPNPYLYLHINPK